MIDVTITISGPGQCICDEMELIALILRLNGAKVTVEDQYCDNDRESDFNLSNTRIKLIAEHLPWGG